MSLDVAETNTKYYKQTSIFENVISSINEPVLVLNEEISKSEYDSGNKTTGFLRDLDLDSFATRVITFVSLIGLLIPIIIVLALIKNLKNDKNMCLVNMIISFLMMFSGIYISC